MPVVDYRQFINRDLPLRVRACESKAVYVRAARPVRVPQRPLRMAARWRRTTVASATGGTSATADIGIGHAPDDRAGSGAVLACSEPGGDPETEPRPSRCLEEASVMSPRRLGGVRLPVLLVALALLVPAPGLLLGQEQMPGVSADPAHNLPLPCEALATPGLVPRSARNLTHVANVCGFVGTDVEFQSRRDGGGDTHDYAFVGTMGAGLRIFDITDPAHPFFAGGYLDPGWQNDVQVRGDTAVVSFDPVVVGPHVSACLRTKQPTAVTEGGVDVIRLSYDRADGAIHDRARRLLRRADRGQRRPQLHAPSERAVAGDRHDPDRRRGRRPAQHAAPDGSQDPVRRSSARRTTPRSRAMARRCTPPAQEPERSSSTCGTSSGADATTIAFIPNNTEPGGASNPRNLTTSHQADVSSNGSVLVFTDERGGGLSNTSCNTAPGGIIGGMHFWALGSVPGGPTGASPATPKRLGSWFYPNPTLAVDPLEPVLAGLGRTERGCTIHVFRNGGNGSVGPGADPVRLRRRLVAAGHPGCLRALRRRRVVDRLSRLRRTPPTASPRASSPTGATPAAGTSCPAPTRGRPRSTRATSTPAT